MKYYIVAGEASGDLHGSNLIRALKSKDPDAEIRCWGGDKMRDAGGRLVEHYKNIAFMGFWEVVLHLPLILRKIKYCKSDIIDYKPDVVILIDYPGFNLRIARFVSGISIPLIYYISPQIWAWKESRIHKIKEYVNRMLVILPFEKEFYKKWGVDADYIGHPLLDVIGRFHFKSREEFYKEYRLEDKPVIAFLPGSRKQEIKKMLVEMVKVSSDFENYQFVVAATNDIDDSFYKKIIGNRKVRIVKDDTYNVLNQSYSAVVTSGTATIETALIGTPQIICYKGSFLSYQIGKRLVKVKYIGMPNLLLQDGFLPELIQSGLNRKDLSQKLKLINSEEERSKIIGKYEQLKQKLDGEGASDKAASIIVEHLSDKNH